MPTLIDDLRVHQALTHLLADHSEFGAMALNLTYKSDPRLPAAMATDGTHCFYNPARLDSRTDANNQFTIAHETLHCALGHIWRAAALAAEGFTHSEINEAADYAVNTLLIAANVGTPADGILYDPTYDNLSFEQIARLRRAIKQAQQQAQQPQPQPQQPDDTDTEDDTDAQPDTDSTEDDSSDDDAQPQDSSNSDTTGEDDPQDGSESDTDADAGDDDDASGSDAASSDDSGQSDLPGDSQASDAPGSGAFDLLPPVDDSQPDTDDSSTSADADAADSTPPLSQDDWQVAVEQAFAVSKKAGQHSGDVERAVQASRQVDPSCWETLRQFVEATVPSDTSWLRPNRRYITVGQYLPGTQRENTPPLVIAIDTSGSVTQPMLDEFAEHITALAAEFHPRAIHVIYADDGVRAVQTFDDGDDIKLGARGGGGTTFGPTFAHIAEDEAGIYDEMAALIYITDLQACDISSLTEPDYPVLWATPSYYRDAEPFGERVWLT